MQFIWCCKARAAWANPWSPRRWLQYLAADKAAALLCADTDLVNDTCARYGAFGAQRIKILNANKNIDARAFDSLIATVLAHESHCMIDNGAFTFIELSAYLKANRVVELLHKRNQEALGKDMELLVSKKLTFDEAISSPVFSLMPRQRLRIIQKSVFEQLGALALDGHRTHRRATGH